MPVLSTTAALARAGGLAMAAGSLFLAGGVAAWCTVAKQLKDEDIVVPDNAPVFAGRVVQDPATAFVQALVIKRNSESLAGGRTFAEVGERMREVEKSSDEYGELRAQQETLATAASLRASLMTSVLAFGVSALAAGIGGVLVLVGRQLRRSSRN